MNMQQRKKKNGIIEIRCECFFLGSFCIGKSLNGTFKMPHRACKMLGLLFRLL